MKAEYDAKNAVILGASFDSPAEKKKFSEKFNFNFLLICDTDRTIGTAYCANADPQKGAQRVGVVIDGTARSRSGMPASTPRWPAEVAPNAVAGSRDHANPQRVIIAGASVPRCGRATRPAARPIARRGPPSTRPHR